MTEFENKIKKFSKRRRITLALVVLIILGSLISNIGSKFYDKKDVATNAKVANTNIKGLISNPSDNTIKIKLPKPSTNANNTIKAKVSQLSTGTSINLIKSKVNPKESLVESSAIEVYKSDGHKIAYLTFDDGPSANTTPVILKILDSYNIKATFFIIGSMAIINPNLVKMEFKDGQSIGNHTYSHDYKYLYSDSSANAFINDVNKCDTVLKSIIGNDYNSKILRFPGGSFGAKMAPFRASLKRIGYHYVDWNDLTGDAEGQNIPVETLISNLKKYTIGKEHVVILMHDEASKETTVQALPQVIEYLKSQGYSFNTFK